MISIIKHFFILIKRVVKYCIYSIAFFFSKKEYHIPYDDAVNTLEEYCYFRNTDSVISDRHFSNEYDLSIIIPAYNQGLFLDKCLDSICTQITDKRVLVIVVDDGSVDKTATILDECAFLVNKNATLIAVHSINRGVSAARNVGLDLANSSYLMFVDSDDYILPNTIQLLTTMADEQHADLVEANGFIFDDSGRRGKMRVDNAISGFPCNKLFRTNLWRNIKYPEDMWYEDTIVRSMVVPLSKKNVITDQEVYAYRYVNGSASHLMKVNPKKLDSVWILRVVNDGRIKLGLKLDNDYIHFLISHIALTVMWRLFDAPRNVQNSSYTVLQFYLKKYGSPIVYTNNTELERRICSLIIEGKFDRLRWYILLIKEKKHL